MEHIECNDCKQARLIAEYGERIKTLEKEVETYSAKNSLDHKDFYAKFEKLFLNNKELEVIFQVYSEKLDKISEDIQELKDKPNKRTDSFFNAIIACIGSGVGTAIIFVLARALYTTIL